MSSQRSNWRERLHANPSRMEHELALKLQDDRVNYLTQVRDTCDHGRLLLPARTATVDRVRRWPGPPEDSPDDEGRRTTNSIAKKRIQVPRTELQWLLG